MQQIEAIVVSQARVASDCMLLEIEAPEIAGRVAAGQFAKIRCSKSFDPLLRRPLSFHAVARDRGRVSFLYQVRGKGTGFLQQLSAGEKLEILAPLGNGFDLRLAERKPAVLVGGGVGIAPLYQLARDLMQKGNEVIIVFGAASQEGLYRQEAFQSLGVDFRIATEDGSAGYHGLVTAPLTEVLPGASAVYTCGPRSMMGAVAAQAAEAGLPCQVSLESRMACGTGACLGCVTPVKEDTEQGWRYARVCAEGPVFSAEEVCWNERG